MCKNKAVSRATEYRHWKESLLVDNLQRTSSSTCAGDAIPSNQENSASNLAATDENEEEAGCSNLDAAIDDNASSNSSVQNSDGMEVTNTVEETALTRIPINCNLSSNEALTDIDHDIAVAVLKAFQLMEDVGGSQKNLLDIINYGKELYCKGDIQLLNRWPSSWSACINVLKKAGYKEPLTYFACLNASHPCLWSVLEKPSDVCQYCSQTGTIEFYYLRLADKIKRWCASKTFCEKITAHWKQKDHWLDESHGEILNEIWDGSRFSELSWFWDPDKQWLLPTRCKSCKSVISADIITGALEQNICNVLEVECPYCHYCFKHSPCYATGDPRNIALIAHWDGWQPFSTSIKHSCGSVEVQIATMTKYDRSRTEEVYVSCFIPSYKLPNKTPWSLDPFLCPLVTEVEDLFIEGLEVNYNGRVAGIEPGPAVLRCLILCWTGDHPAQCEVGKFLNAGGVHACRRDKLEGMQSSTSSHYYYGNYRYHYRHPWPERSLQQSIVEMKDVDEEERQTVRQKLASEYGFTGLSILHRFYSLYKFDILKDLVFDSMHTLLLRIVKRHIDNYSEHGYLSNPLIERRLQAMPWTAEMKDGRIPEGITHRIGYWKAEEFQKFAFPASEMVLGGILPENNYHVWILIVRIVELVFSCGRNGWTKESLQLLEKLIWRHNILTEEVEGFKSCVITIHNLTHLPEDVHRFSSPDNFWCFVFERAVHNYVERSSNHKNLELTFAKAESRRELLKLLFHSATSYPSHLQPMNVQQCTQTIPYASSIEQAKQKFDSSNITDPILVGGKKSLLLSTDDIPGLAFDNDEIIGTTCRSIAFVNCQQGKRIQQYRTGENVLMAIGGEIDHEVVCVTDFFTIKHSGKEHLFVKGEKYTTVPGNSIHSYSSSQLVKPTSLLAIYPVSSLLRKVMLYPEPENIDSPSYYVVIDFQRPQLPFEAKDVIVPAYPLIEDMLLVNGDDGNLWHAHVISVNHRDKLCKVAFYVEDQSIPGRYKKEVTRCRLATEMIHWDTIICQAHGYWEGEYWIDT